MSWVHSSAGLTSSMADPFARATLEGLQRSLAKPVTKKEPVSIEILGAIVEDAERSGSLSDLRLATACLLSFLAFCVSMSSSTSGHVIFLFRKR